MTATNINILNIESCGNRIKMSDELTESILGVPNESLEELTKKIASYLAERKHIARDTAKEFDAKKNQGQRAADAVAIFGGSWTFIIFFTAILVIWVGLNSFILVKYDRVFDSYPYILLNLFLSMLAAIQAPIILMSQNRQAEKDRLNAEHDYEVNLKAELEIMLLHEKMDLLRESQWAELLAIQNEQIKLLGNLIAQNIVAE